jgi:formamidopyrimidine-DNA glycosylase
VGVPELPDVEDARRYWARHGSGRAVEGVVTLDAAIVRNVSPEELDAALKGHRLEEPHRHGKWLIGRSEGPSLLLHFGMTGELRWAPDDSGRHRHDRVVIQLDEGELRYRNMRKLGGVWLARDSEEEDALIGGLGPDALTLGRADFVELVARRRGNVKAALTDQTLVAGIGNLVADELLWHARIHPGRAIQDLSPKELARIHPAMKRVVTRWVEGYGSLPRGWLIRVRGPDQPCPRCDTPLSRISVRGRTTYYCPRCQPENAA